MREPLRIVSETEFRARLLYVLIDRDLDAASIGAVTGPGRSGAIAAVYTSHMLRVPFIPYGANHPAHLGRLLIVDTASQSGRTLRKAQRRYQADTPIMLALYVEPPRVAFWYEAPKPQRYAHEQASAA